MDRYDIQAGQRFGKLVCLTPMDERRAKWLCRCDCGAERLATSSELLRGRLKSCGCLRRPPLQDLTGRRFGQLTVTGYAGKADGFHLWQCRCGCGADAVVRQNNLLSGHTKSCGCLQRSMHRKNMRLVDGTSVSMIEHRKQTPIRSNTSGCSGVYMNRKTGMWTAQITFKGHTYYLGSFADKKDAIAARHKGERMYDDFLAWYYAAGADAEHTT